MGCTETGPSGIQRLAPLMAGAKGDRVISKSSSEKNRAGYCNLYNHSRGAPEGHAAARGKEQLTLEKVVFVAVDLLGHNAAGREHHDQTDGQDGQHDGEQPPVKGGAGTLFRSPGKGAAGFALLGFGKTVFHASLLTMRLKSSPRAM